MSAIEDWKRKHGPKPQSLEEWMAVHKRTGVTPPDILAGQREVESAGNDRAKSGAGAIGPMQIIPKAQNLDPKVVADPATNLEIGARIMDKLTAQFGGDTTRALRAYNQGAKNERNRTEDEMPKEAREYPAKVIQASMKYEKGDRPDSASALAERHAPIRMADHWYDPLMAKAKSLAAMLGVGYNTPTTEGPSK
jgi:soluble lytic murein transglycosylase-like protein